MHERTLETRKPSCIPMAAKPFFIPVVHSPPEAVGHMVALELSPRRGRAQSHGTRGSVGAHLGREVRSGAKGHVAALKLISARRQVWGRGTCGSAGAQLGREARSGATGHMAALDPTSAVRRGPRPRDTWQRHSPRLQGGEI
jgi:hypothetical protein